MIQRKMADRVDRNDSKILSRADQFTSGLSKWELRPGPGNVLFEKVEGVSDQESNGDGKNESTPLIKQGNFNLPIPLFS